MFADKRFVFVGGILLSAVGFVVSRSNDIDPQLKDVARFIIFFGGVLTALGW